MVGSDVRVGGYVELRISVRAAAAAHLQTILGFWPAFLTAFALRAHGVFRFPFLDEEGYLIRDAVNSLFGFGPQSGLAPFWENFLFRVPFWNSQAITPLWWWTQYLARLAVPVEDLSTRLPEFAFGLLGLALFIRLARSLFAPPIPGLLAWLLAVHDVFLWVGTKAQYVEAFIFCCAVLVAWGLLDGRGKWQRLVVAAGAAIAALGYFLMKGLTLVATALVFSVGQWGMARAGGRRPTIRALAMRALAVSALALPLAAWLIAGQAYVTAHYQVRFGNKYVQNIGQMVYWLTIGYGTGKGESLVGPPRFAFTIYSHADAWPVSTVLAPIIACGLGLALFGVARPIVDVLVRGKLPNAASPPASSLALYVVVSMGLTLAPLALKGTFGARYHVMYLPAALFAAGLALDRLWAARHGRWGGLIALTGVYVGAMLSWADWTAGLWRPGWPFVAATVAGAVLGAGYALGGQFGRRAVVVIGVGLAVGLSLARGPLIWGHFAPFEPEPRSPVLMQVEAMYHGKGA